METQQDKRGLTGAHPGPSYLWAHTAIPCRSVQVDHLLFCGADLAVVTAAGETAAELVPLCGDRGAAGQPPGQRACRCMSTAEGQARPFL